MSAANEAIRHNRELNAIENAARDHLIQPWEGISTLGEDVRTVITGGDGIYLIDGEGNRLMDGPGGMWCVQIGYGRQEMADAVAKQSMSLPYNSPWSSTNSPAAKLAKRIAGLTPGDLNHVFFTNSGSTAMDSAVRFVHFYNNAKGRKSKKMVIARDKGYHGSTYLAASISGKERDKNYFDFATDRVVHISCPNPYRRPDGMSVEDFCDAKVKELEDKILELGPENVGAFVAEPIMASGGLIIPPKGYHAKTLEVCRKHDVLYISDEVVTAFGRLGEWFASETIFGIVPDMITFAKGVTSGYQPLGGVAISDRLLQELNDLDKEDVTYSNGYTYSGHPVCCAAAMTNLDIIEREGILEHVREVGPYFQKRLKELEDLPIVGEVRGLGLMGCVECVADRHSKNALELDKEVGSRIDKHTFKRGLIVRPIINMCVMSPVLTITKAEIDTMVDILRAGIEDTMDELEAEGIWSRDKAA
ncbi:MAG: aminotransferase [Alphaproteobacteria bacterium]